MIQNETERSKAQEVALVSSMLDIRTYSAFQRLRDAKLLAMPQKGARGQEDTMRKSVLPSSMCSDSLLFLQWAASEHISWHLRILFVSSIQKCLHVWFV